MKPLIVYDPLEGHPPNFYRLPIESHEYDRVSEPRAPEFSSLHSLATYQLSWKEISWANASWSVEQGSKSHTPHREDQARPPELSPTIRGSARVSIEQMMNREEEILETHLTSMDEPTISQYLQMAEGIQDYLTWDPTLFDFNGP